MAAAAIPAGASNAARAIGPDRVLLFAVAGVSIRAMEAAS
jgi:hypothetical protein